MLNESDHGFGIFSSIFNPRELSAARDAELTAATLVAWHRDTALRGETRPADPRTTGYAARFEDAAAIAVDGTALVDRDRLNPSHRSRGLFGTDALP